MIKWTGGQRSTQGEVWQPASALDVPIKDEQMSVWSKLPHEWKPVKDRDMTHDWKHKQSGPESRDSGQKQSPPIQKKINKVVNEMTTDYLWGKSGYNSWKKLMKESSLFSGISALVDGQVYLAISVCLSCPFYAVLGMSAAIAPPSNPVYI